MIKKIQILFLLFFSLSTFAQDKRDSANFSKSLSVTTLFSPNTAGISYGLNFILQKNKDVVSLGLIVGHPLYFIRQIGYYNPVEKPKEYYALKGINFNISHALYDKKRKIKLFAEYDLLYIYYRDKDKQYILENVIGGIGGEYHTVDWNAQRHVFENFIGYNININITDRFYLYHQMGIGFSTIFNKQTYSNNETSLPFFNTHYSDWFNWSMLIKFGLGYHFIKSKKKNSP